MKSKRIFYLALLIGIVLSLGTFSTAPAQAQEEVTAPALMSLDTVLAQATAEGFLTTLIRPALAGMTEFYLADNLQA